MIELRRARHEDKGRIEDISSRIWEGDDYLPQVFEKWVDEKTGEFTVIAVNGTVAGCSKITALPESVLWLEGIRVDTNYRGLGLGKQLADYQLVRAGEIGYSRLELSTFALNHESLAIIRKRGFKEVAAFKFLFCDLKKSAGSEAVQNEPILPQAVTNPSESKHLLEKIKEGGRGGYLNFDWTFIQASEQLIEDMIERGSIYKYKDTYFALGDWGQKDDGLTLYFMYGPERQAVLTHIKAYAFENGHSNIMYMAEADEQLQAQMHAQGFTVESEAETDVFVFRYQKQLNAGRENE
jgi:N-acetylglutamate synthase-like GNAT family acetyltransferase